MADIKMWLKKEPKKYTELMKFSFTDPQYKDKCKNQRGCNSHSHVDSSPKYAKVKSPLMWRFPTQTHLKACSCSRSSIPVLNKTANWLDVLNKPIRHHTKNSFLPSLIGFLYKVQIKSELFPSHGERKFSPQTRRMLPAMLRISHWMATGFNNW